MKIRMIKGTNQIGGCITEICTKKAKIIIDFGEDLPDETSNKKEEFHLPGLTEGRKAYDAVLITHSHGDHIGLINNIKSNIDIYVEECSKKIFDLTNAFTGGKKVQKQTIPFTFNKPFTIKNEIKVTPFRTDHSAYNSAMFLIEAEGIKVLHTGDFRSHGRKKEEFLENIKKIGEVDVLITEGTCLAKEDTEIETETEEELEQRAKKVFEQYNQVFILQSSTNIDRIVSFYKAARDTGKNFIEDMFTTNITTNLKGIPNPKDFKIVYAWNPIAYRKKSRAFKSEYIAPFKKYTDSNAVHKDFCMMVKNSMMEDIALLKSKKLLTNACFVYSMWEGYQKQEKMQEFLKFIEESGIDYHFIHTSGHADKKTLKYMEEQLKPKIIFPIHTTKKEKAPEVFKNAHIVEDNEVLNIKELLEENK